MSIRVALHHRTTYRYDRAVHLGPQVVRLRPAPHSRTFVESYSLRVKPERHFLNWQQDPHGSYLARLVFPDTTRLFEVDVDLVAELGVKNPFDFFLEPEFEKVPIEYEASLARDLLPYRRTDPQGPKLAALLREVRSEGIRTVDFLVALNQRLHQMVRYLIRMEPGVQSPEQTLEIGSGSCRDSAWLLVQALRHLGFAARFASGYLIQLEPDVKALDGPSGADHDFTDLHAWAEVYLPGAGWIGLDPTSGLLAGEGHIPLACTPEPMSAAPVSGAVEKCEVEFAHELSVQRIAESPRVTKPYSDEQWESIMACGRAVDADLASGDVRLTMGGEPTFVSVTDRDADEWNIAALGPTKRAKAADLLFRLQRRYAPNGFVHFGQGKWYPGEPLPRWALGCFWRTDGEAAWTDASLFADERVPDGHGAPDAECFIVALAGRLNVTPDHVQTGYEDVWYYLWRERQLPANVDPFDARLDDEMERERLRRVFTQGLHAIVGYALPIRRVAERWSTGPWFLRDERMYLMPGDSPMGLRLPLDSLPWSAPGDRLAVDELDPFAARDPLTQSRIAVSGAPNAAAPRPVSRGESARGVIRSALCVEPRGGILYVFMPPVESLEDYLDLIAAVEDTSGALGIRVLLEGYPPPNDPRLSGFLVTPDPGGIEVNAQPSSTWDQVVEQTTLLYEDARHTGVRT